MPYREISFTAISSVDDSGIQFTNGEKILFEDCVAARREQVGNGYDGVGVADRKIIADPPYIEFAGYATFDLS